VELVVIRVRQMKSVKVEHAHHNVMQESKYAERRLHSNAVVALPIQPNHSVTPQPPNRVVYNVLAVHNVRVVKFATVVVHAESVALTRSVLLMAVKYATLLLSCVWTHVRSLVVPLAKPAISAQVYVENATLPINVLQASNAML
jgi:hypothetical protein